MHNYNIIEDRPELTKEQVLAGMSFGVIQNSLPVQKKIPANAVLVAGIAAVIIVFAIFIYDAFSSEQKIKKDEPLINDTIKQNKTIINSDVPIKESIKELTQKNSLIDTSHTPIKQKETIAAEETENTEEIKTVRSLSFQRLSYADAEYAIEIKDSIYGPVNVSRGYGEYFEYGDRTNRPYSEKNSAWFRFTIKRDTLLTFHIVPTLGTDDYDFVLFKCVSNNCEQLLRANKIKPERVCFSWNSSNNKNTGLSRLAKDTLFEETTFTGEKKGKSYAPALKVKAGDIYYLMITNNMRVQNQDPEGFMIYFYNYLPKQKANKYK